MKPFTTIKRVGAYSINPPVWVWWLIFIVAFFGGAPLLTEFWVEKVDSAGSWGDQRDFSNAELLKKIADLNRRTSTLQFQMMLAFAAANALLARSIAAKKSAPEL